ncbi:MAG: sulfurtransferase TusA family protein [Candidatus Krumholzibacteriota bacterium]|nr:sulfurtransferase TusA family protein [Candidatus Krumholzibacteriota bacterium]
MKRRDFDTGKSDVTRRDPDGGRNNAARHDAELDCVGLYCPLPILMTKQALGEIEVGRVLKVVADDPAAEQDIKSWAKRAGQEILEFGKKDSTMTFLIKRLK